MARWAYAGTLALLALALAFPIALMVLNPTLMFERGWEQYVGTTIYIGAVWTLGWELLRLWRDERALAGAGSFLALHPIDAADTRVLPSRIRQLTGHGSSVTVAQIMELNREASGLDQEATAGRFTLTRYILYLLPVIGFIGTVEGISKALMNISRVLPMVNDLDGFLKNLTGVTAALQIAFDSTLLALFLSAALMLVQTLVHRRAEDLLARVDRWVVENLLPRLGSPNTGPENLAAALAPQLKRIEQALEALGGQFGPHVDRFAGAVDRLPPALVAFQRGAETIGRIGSDLEDLGQAGDALRKGVATLARIETALVADAGHDEQLEQIRRGVERTCTAIESLAGQWSAAFERSNRASQEQLARTLNSLKDALDLLHVSIDQGNSLYRSIVKKMFDDRGVIGSETIRAA
jgi:biopolymer transport protein ExbB/TolQ